MPRAYLGMSVPGFPNMFLLYGPNTNGGTGSVDLHDRGRDGPRDRRASRARAGRRRPDRGPAARCAEQFDRELRAALAGTVWHTGCTNWYVDEDGNDPSQWPWLWSTYRRRTARLEPGAYERAAPGAVASGSSPAQSSRDAQRRPARRSRPRTSATSSATAFPATSGSSRWRSRTPTRAAGSSSTAATCTRVASSTAAPGPRSATPSPPGRPFATSRRARLHDDRAEAERLRPGLPGDEIVAVATPLHAGSTTVVIEVRSSASAMAASRARGEPDRHPVRPAAARGLT